MAILVFDIETVPDYAAYARLLGLPADTQEALLEEAWTAAQRPFKAELQQIVSLAAA